MLGAICDRTEVAITLGHLLHVDMAHLLRDLEDRDGCTRHQRLQARGTPRVAQHLRTNGIEHGTLNRRLQLVPGFCRFGSACAIYLAVSLFLPLGFRVRQLYCGTVSTQSLRDRKLIEDFPKVGKHALLTIDNRARKK